MGVLGGPRGGGDHNAVGSCVFCVGLKGYLAHKEPCLPRTVQ